MRYQFFLLFLTLLSLLTCFNKNEELMKSNLKNEMLDHNIYTKKIQIYPLENQLQLIYSDESTVSLKKAVYTPGHIRIDYIDSIDIDSRLNPVFGKNYFFYKDGFEYLFYYDQQKEKKAFFKLLKKSKQDQNYSLSVFQFNLIDFEVLENGIFHVIFYDQELKLALIRENELFILENSSFKIKQLKKLKCQFDQHNLKIVYSNTQDELYQADIVIDYRARQFKIENQTIIDKEIELFDFKWQEQSGHILYTKKDHSLNYYQSETRNIIGYFYSIQDLHLMINHNKAIILFSDFEIKTEQNKEDFAVNYSLKSIYQNRSKKWTYEKIFQSPTPIYGINSLIKQNKIYIAIGGNNLQLLTLNRNVL